MSATVKKFVFGPFMENTYVVYDETKECVIIDPGCFDSYECEELKSFVDSNGLKPVKHLLTHSHLDHIMGCEFVSKTWGLTPEIHPIDKIVYDNFLTSVQMYQLRGTSTPPEPHCTLSEGDTIRFGVTQFKVHFVPGHSPGHVAFECAQSGFVIVGDVLFQRSIGRTDLPGGNFETLIQSIKNVLFKLDLNLKVYCGHGDETTLLEEKMHNPFLVN